MFRLRACAASASLLGFLAASAVARDTAVVVAAELEPNGTKSEANSVLCLGPGSSIQGATTGAGALAGDASIASADTFRIRVCAHAPGIWRHRLVLTTVGVDDFALSIRGLVVNGPSASPSIDPASDAPLQVVIGVNGQPHFVQWYGFGQEEELFVRVTGTPSTLAPYVLTLESVPVAESIAAVALRSGVLELTTFGQGHNTDTELFVLDANRTAIPGFRNDDAPGGATSQSRLTRMFAAGTYYLGVGRFNVTDSALSGTDDAYQFAPVLDFPRCLLSWSSSGSPNVSFAITDVLGTTAVPVLLPAEPFQVAWFRLTVVDPPPPITAVCFGDGSGTPCPCGNPGVIGSGCANSINPAGGLLVASGLASVSLDSFVLAGSGMPVSSALYFQGTSLLSGGDGQAFGDGLRCAGGSIVRLESQTNFGGVSAYPGLGGTPISVRGQIPSSGGARVYQLWYRNSAPGFCTPAFYNLTNAIAATWIP